MSDITDLIRLIGAGIIGIALVAVVLSSVFGLAIDLSSGEAVLEPAPETATEVDEIDQPADDLRVRATTGNALYLAGDGAYVNDSVPDEVYRNGSWTVGMVVEPEQGDLLSDPAFDDDDTLTLYAADNERVHLLFEQGNWTARYDTGTETAYVEAPADLDGRTAVSASYDETGDELRLYVDGNPVDTDQPDTTIVPRNAAYSWIGSVDEVRVANATWSDSRHGAYASDPVQPLPENASARLMFNDGRVTTAYYAPGEAAIVGETQLVDGVDGPDLVRGEDYAVTSEPFTFRTISGGYLDGAPVVFLAGAGGVFGGLLETLQTTGVSALGLLVVGLLVAAAVWVQDQFSDF